jgi:hypothetical protein
MNIPDFFKQRKKNPNRNLLKQMNLNKEKRIQIDICWNKWILGLRCARVKRVGPRGLHFSSMLDSSVRTFHADAIDCLWRASFEHAVRLMCAYAVLFARVRPTLTSLLIFVRAINCSCRSRMLGGWGNRSPSIFAFDGLLTHCLTLVGWCLGLRILSGHSPGGRSQHSAPACCWVALKLNRSLICWADGLNCSSCIYSLDSNVSHSDFIFWLWQSGRGRFVTQFGPCFRWINTLSFFYVDENGDFYEDECMRRRRRL